MGRQKEFAQSFHEDWTHPCNIVYGSYSSPMDGLGRVNYLLHMVQVILVDPELFTGKKQQHHVDHVLGLSCYLEEPLNSYHFICNFEKGLYKPSSSIVTGNYIMG